jgi:hypothetical protein
MRRLAPIGLALAGLALAAPTTLRAEKPATSAPGHKHPRGLFGKRKLCVECQRAELRAKEGIDMPAPPPLPQGVVMEGGSCPTCPPGGSMMVVSGEAPGHAMVGGPAPGYAVAGGAEPAPIAAVQPRGMAQVAGRSAPTDRSVMPTSIPAPDPMPNAGHNRPHIISHLFGLSAIGQTRREEAEKRAGQKHASIRYDNAPSPKVTELPSSVVYGRRWW